jgi:hypothetical protein
MARAVGISVSSVQRIWRATQAGLDANRLNQRHNREKMSPERRARLDALGFVWSVKDETSVPGRITL